MPCPRCRSENPDGALFCGDCGFPLAPGITYLEEKLERQVEKAISAKFKDQRLVALETSDIVLNRITTHAKIYLWLAGGLMTLTLAGITIVGLKKYNDFAGLVQEAQTQVRPKLDAAKKEADEAERTAKEATNIAAQARIDIERARSDVQGELKKASGIAAEVETLSRRVSDLEKETTRKITDANRHVASQVSDLDGKVATALGDISKQEEKLANTDELVEALFSKGETELFPISNNQRFVALPVGDHVDVYMLLRRPPIFQTFQLQLHIYVQPKNSYVFIGNVMLFKWGQSLDSLKAHPLIVSYIPNPRASADIRQLTVKDGVVYADGQQLPKL
jgi:hypothetical protein